MKPAASLTYYLPECLQRETCGLDAFVTSWVTKTTDCPRLRSHPVDRGRGLRQRGVGAGGEGLAEDSAGVAGVDDAVVPEAGGGVEGAALLFVLVVEELGRLGLADLFHHRGGHIAAHTRDPGVGPHEEDPGRVGTAAHAVVAGAEGAADDDGQLGDAGGGDSGDHLGAVLGDPPRLVLGADHKAVDVLEEDEGDAPLVAELDE